MPRHHPQLSSCANVESWCGCRAWQTPSLCRLSSQSRHTHFHYMMTTRRWHCACPCCAILWNCCSGLKQDLQHITVGWSHIPLSLQHTVSDMFSETTYKLKYSLNNCTLASYRLYIYYLLPPVSTISHNYSLRPRAHGRQLSERSPHVMDNYFITWMLYCNVYWRFM